MTHQNYSFSRKFWYYCADAMFPAQWSSDHIVSSIGISQIWITDESSPTAATVRVSIHLICFAWIDFWYLHHSIKTFRQNIFEHICKKINICHVLRLQSGLFCHPNIIAMKNIVSIYNIYHLKNVKCTFCLPRHRGSRISIQFLALNIY